MVPYEIPERLYEHRALMETLIFIKIDRVHGCLPTALCRGKISKCFKPITW